MSKKLQVAAAVALVLITLGGIVGSAVFWAGETTGHVRTTEAKVDGIDGKLDQLHVEVAELASNQARIEGYLAALHELAQDPGPTLTAHPPIESAVRQ